MVYLDNAATSFPRPESVLSEMDRVNRTLSVNAGRGSYKAAREASDIIHDTKTCVEALFDCAGSADVVFTPSVTYAINRLLDGLDIQSGTTIYLSVYEHNAVARTVQRVRKQTGCNVEMIPVDPETLRIDIDKTRYLFTQKKPDIVIMSVISNVTGYRLPVESVFAIAKEYGAVTIADAAQAAGLVKLQYDAMSADAICFAGHKTMCGPFGIGGFVIRHGMDLKQTFSGGTGSDSLNLEMPETISDGFEAGSPDIVAVAGLNAALKTIDQKEHEEKIRFLTGELLNRLFENPDVIVLGNPDPNDHLGIVSFVVEGYDSNDVGKILDDEFDIAVRTGYHCAPYIHEYLKDIPYHGTIRVGIGFFNTLQDIEYLAETLASL